MLYQSQFDAIAAALESGSYSPPTAIAKAFKQRRLNAVSKALGLTNLFVPAAGHFPQASSKATFTVYTKPLQRDVIVMGCSLMSFDERTDERIGGEFRLRLPEPLEHLSQNYIFPAMAFAPATYSIFFPAPFILRASEQIAIDFGWNAPQANAETVTTRIEIVLFCVAVKNCLASDDLDILKRAEQVINDNDFQRRVLLNSWTHGSISVTSQTDSPFYSSGNQVVYVPQNISSVAVAKGTLTSSETRPADVPLLVIGLALNSCGETVRIMDTGTGHSFTQGEFIYAHSLWYPEESTTFTTRGPYYAYFKLPVPHLLRPGATLFTEHLNSNDALQTAFNPEYMVWECLTP
jgi:hypothetical protein